MGGRTTDQRGSDELLPLVNEAIRLSRREVKTLAAMVEELRAAVLDEWRDVKPRGTTREMANRLRDINKDLEHAFDHLSAKLAERTRKLARFNIVLFGRTGTGKSTLVEALSGGNGAAISQKGKLDNTRKIRPTVWRGLRLVDTPGVEGWSEQATRAQLEREAHDAVGWADVVLLSFDDFNAKVSEFEQIAGWVLDHRKPAVAVVNCRTSDLWRLSPEVPDPHDRMTYSAAVSEHAHHVLVELGRHGLSHAPVVAVQSLRAFAARGTRPLEHPLAEMLDEELERYGPEPLETYSNLGALTQLLSRAVAIDPIGLRVGTLRAEIASELQALGGAVESWRDELQAQASAYAQLARSVVTLIGRPVRRPLDVPPWVDEGSPVRMRVAAERLGVTLRRNATAAELRAAVLGELAVRASADEPHALAFAVAGADDPLGGLEVRSGSRGGRVGAMIAERIDQVVNRHRVAAAERGGAAIREAYEQRKALSEEQFVEAVLDRRTKTAIRREMTQAMRALAADASARMDTSADDVRADLEAELAGLQFDPKAGRWQIWAGRSAVVTGGGLAAVLTGPVGVVALAGFSTFGVWLAGRGRKAAPEARQQAEREAGESVQQLFEQVRSDAHAQARVLITRLARTMLQRPLAEAVALGAAVRALDAVLDSVRETRSRIDSARSPQAILQQAREELERELDGTDPARLWLGEDWLDDVADVRDGAARPRAAVQRPPRGEAITVILPPAGSAARWFDRAALRAVEHADVHAALEAARAVLQRPPGVVLCGDYSTGKTTLVRRLLCERNGEVDDADLVVAGHPTTDATLERPFSSLTIVDTPGLESGNDEHRRIALASIADAALVCFVHVPAFGSLDSLTGGAFRHAQMLGGASARVLRSVHVLARFDELTISPERAPRAFVSLATAKVDEVARALASAGVEVRPEDILTVAADPRGRRAKDQRLIRADFHATQDWDGVSDLLRLLERLEPALLTQGRDAGALDGAAHRLWNVAASLEPALADARAQQHELERIDLSFRRARARTAESFQTSELALRVEIDTHAGGKRAELRTAPASDLKNIARDVGVWVRDGLDPVLAEWATESEARLGRIEADLEADIEARLESRAFRRAFGADARVGGVAAAVDAGKVTRMAVRGIGRSLATSAQRKAGVALAKRMSEVAAKRMAAVMGATLGAALAGLIELLEHQAHERLEARRNELDDLVRDAAQLALAELIDGSDKADGLRAHHAARLTVFDDHWRPVHEACIAAERHTATLESAQRLANELAEDAQEQLAGAA